MQSLRALSLHFRFSECFRSFLLETRVQKNVRSLPKWLLAAKSCLRVSHKVSEFNEWSLSVTRHCDFQEAFCLRIYLCQCSSTAERKMATFFWHIEFFGIWSRSDMLGAKLCCWVFSNCLQRDGQNVDISSSTSQIPGHAVPLHRSQHAVCKPQQSALRGQERENVTGVKTLHQLKTSKHIKMT